MSYNDFVTRYYSEAWDVADKTVRTVIKNNGFKDPRVDYELVKSEGVTAGLDKTYTNYDVDRLREGGMKGFLGTVVRNCTLSALEKAINANKREKNLLVSGKREEKPRYSHLIDDVAQPRPTMTAHDTMEYPDWAEQKEKVIARMEAQMRTLPYIDQVILKAYGEAGRAGYVDTVIAALGMPDNDSSRNTIRIRLTRALKKMKELMGGKKPVYRDFYIPSPAMRNADGRADEFAPVPADRNAVRRRRYAVSRQLGSEIDYASVASKVYSGMLGEDGK